MFWSFFRESATADILHANWSICGCIAGLVGRLRGLPVVTTLRGEDVSRSRTSFADRLILRIALRLSTVIVAVSHSIHASLRSEYPKWQMKLTMIANGVDQCFLNVGYRRKDSKHQSCIRFLTVGSLIPRKGMDQIVSAFSQLRSHRQATLTIVGAGPERPRIEALVADDRLTDRVTFCTAEPAAIPGLLEDAEVFVLASHSEGRPNVILEAMASRLPVIGSNVDGINELICHGENGLLFEDGDCTVLAHHMRTLIENATYRLELGRKAQQFILTQQLLWPRTAASYLSLYESLLGR
jgi:glycosyltransferase involved in cell wall biosynthesis